VNNDIIATCRDAKYKAGNCAHGVGHAVMMATGNNVERSLHGCAELRDPAMEYYCATGVFMEYEDKLMWKGQDVVKPARPSPHYPCDTYVKFPAACYRYMLRHIAGELSGEQLVQECLGLPDRRRRGCFHGMGALYSAMVGMTPTLFPAVCLHGGLEDHIVCIEGVVEMLADHDETQALNACAVLEGGTILEICQAAAREKMYRINKSSLGLYVP
jgi:hypothetical protein